MESDATALSLTLEFVRADQGGDPHAFRMTRQEYLLRSAGGGFESAELGWDDALMADLAAIREAQPEPLLLQRLGETLRHFLKPVGWREHEAAIVAAVQAKRPVVLTLRSAAAELYALPWELLTIKSTGQHLAELPGVLVRYEWPETVTTPPSSALPRSRGRILFCWSAAGGAVPAEEHRHAIERACRDRGHPFSAPRDLIEHVSATSLAEALDCAQSTGETISVLHLLCHGGAVGQNAGLVLDGQESRPHVVDGGQLRRVLAPHAGMVRLVVLAACNSAHSGAVGNQLGSVAQALHRAGIAQVVASRYPLSVAGSIRLAEAVYPTLLSGTGSLESALLKARDSLARQDAHLDWVSLQFFARASDGEFQRPSYLLGGPPPQAPGKAYPPQPPTHEPAARPPRVQTIAAFSLGTLLVLGGAMAGLWHATRALQPSAPPNLASSLPGALPPMVRSEPQARPQANPVAALAAAPTPASAASPLPSDSREGAPADKSGKHDAVSSENPMPIYRGVVVASGKPMKGAKLTLLGTDCAAKTKASGVFIFDSCRDKDGVSRLTKPSVMVHLPASEVRPLACSDKIVSLEKPPAITRIDFHEHCKTQETKAGTKDK